MWRPAVRPADRLVEHDPCVRGRAAGPRAGGEQDCGPQRRPSRCRPYGPARASAGWCCTGRMSPRTTRRGAIVPSVSLAGSIPGRFNRSAQHLVHSERFAVGRWQAGHPRLTLERKSEIWESAAVIARALGRHPATVAEFIRIAAVGVVLAVASSVHTVTTAREGAERSRAPWCQDDAPSPPPARRRRPPPRSEPVSRAGAPLTAEASHRRSPEAVPALDQSGVAGVVITHYGREAPRRRWSARTWARGRRSCCAASRAPTYAEGFAVPGECSQGEDGSPDRGDGCAAAPCPADRDRPAGSGLLTIADHPHVRSTSAVSSRRAR